MAQKCGNCQINWIPKMIKASWEITPVAAVQPSRGGSAPGIAPTNTAIGPTRFRGVYTKLYNTIDTNESIVVRGFVYTISNVVPTVRQSPENIHASCTVTLCLGSGLF